MRRKRYKNLVSELVRTLSRKRRDGVPEMFRSVFDGRLGLIFGDGDEDEEDEETGMTRSSLRRCHADDTPVPDFSNKTTLSY